MKPGTKPRPEEIKRLHGEKNKDRYNPGAPKPEKKRPTCPMHLCPVARTEWRRISAELEGLGLLTRIDRAALAAYCEAYGEWVEASLAMKGHRLTIVTDKLNIIQNPLIGIKHKAAEQMHKFLTEFGMTPSSRSRITIEDTEDPGDAMSRLLNHPTRKN